MDDMRTELTIDDIDDIEVEIIGEEVDFVVHSEYGSISATLPIRVQETRWVWGWDYLEDPAAFHEGGLVVGWMDIRKMLAEKINEIIKG